MKTKLQLVLHYLPRRALNTLRMSYGQGISLTGSFKTLIFLFHWIWRPSAILKHWTVYFLRQMRKVVGAKSSADWKGEKQRTYQVRGHSILMAPTPWEYAKGKQTPLPSSPSAETKWLVVSYGLFVRTCPLKETLKL